MRTHPHILVIFGSTRQGRRGEAVVHWLMERLEARTDMTSELVDLRHRSLPFFDSPISPVRGPIDPAAEGWAARVDEADGFIFVTPEYNHGYPAALKNAIDHLYHQWVHKPAAIVSYGGIAAGYRAAEQLRQVFVEVKMVPIREQVGISLVPGAVPSISDTPDSPGGALLERVYNGMVTELLWWANALMPARERDRQRPSGMNFDAAYAGTPPWDIGRPQQAYVELVQAGKIHGDVLDVGCGTGEHALYIAQHGHEVWGIDSSLTAIGKAQQKAEARGIAITFQVADALQLQALGRTFDTVIDSGLFHVFSDEDRVRYVQSLASVLLAGGSYYLLCFSDQEPERGPGPRRVSQAEIEATFSQGWQVEQIQATRFETTFGWGAAAWLAAIRRV